MTTDEPLDLTMKKMNRVMDEMEKLLGPRGRLPADAPPARAAAGGEPGADGAFRLLIGYTVSS